MLKIDPSQAGEGPTLLRRIHQDKQVRLFIARERCHSAAGGLIASEHRLPPCQPSAAPHWTITCRLHVTELWDKYLYNHGTLAIFAYPFVHAKNFAEALPLVRENSW